MWGERFIPNTKLGKGAMLISAVGLLLFGFRSVAPFIWTEPAQDQCDFGPISNLEYRSLLGKAKALQSSEWPAVRGQALDMGELISQRIQQLDVDRTDIYRRIAVMHAVLRALGASYRNNALAYTEDYLFDRDRMSYDMFDSTGYLGFLYEIDVVHLGSIEPVVRTALLGISLNARPQSAWRLLAQGNPPNNNGRKVRLYDRPANVFTVGVIWPDYTDLLSPAGNERASFRSGLPCPLLPSRLWAQRYRDWISTNPKALPATDGPIGLAPSDIIIRN